MLLLRWARAFLISFFQVGQWRSDVNVDDTIPICISDGLYLSFNPDSVNENELTIGNVTESFSNAIHNPRTIRLAV
jgi:hypothetical protein